MKIPDDGIKRRRCDVRFNLVTGRLAFGERTTLMSVLLKAESISLSDNPDGLWVVCYNPATHESWIELRSDLVTTGWDQTRTILDPPQIG